MRSFRIILWAMVAIAAVLFGVMFFQQSRGVSSEPVSHAANPAKDFGGAFTLVGADGKPFSSTELAGKPYALFFGFTHCPDVCPTTLARLVRLRQELGGSEPQILFVTVDPKRDGPKEVGTYASLFNAPIVGLTGSPEQIAQVKKQFGIFSQEVNDGAGGYTVDHTASVLLFGKDGAFAGTISPEESDEMARAKLKRITA